VKILFIADIHGSLYFTRKALEAFEKEGADYIALLGDELYHGPRNPLPAEYNPIEVAGQLNKIADKIIAVKGNCDSEVDQMVFDFPIMSAHSVILYNGRRLFLTHGHIYNENKLPELNAGDVLIYGHTHINNVEKRGDIFIINLASVALPKDNNPNSYGILNNDVFRIKDFDGNVIKEICFS